MRDRLPMAHDELGSVVAATAGATNSIMEAAEAILVIEDSLLELAEGLDHLRDALAGDVLEGAGLEDLVDPALDNSIMEAAEAILVIEDSTLDGYRAKVESRIYEIFPGSSPWWRSSRGASRAGRGPRPPSRCAGR
jgi:hypothetical protein